MSAVMRNCAGACFLGNSRIHAVIRNRCRFEEVGEVYGEESVWRSKTRSTVCMCVCVCECKDRDVWHDIEGSRAVPPSVWVVGCREPDNRECQAMWIKAEGL